MSHTKGLIDTHVGVKSTWRVYYSDSISSPYCVKVEVPGVAPGPFDSCLFDTLASAQRFAREQANMEIIAEEGPCQCYGCVTMRHLCIKETR